MVSVVRVQQQAQVLRQALGPGLARQRRGECRWRIRPLIRWLRGKPA
jgi:hypothetical protein